MVTKEQVKAWLSKEDLRSNLDTESGEEFIQEVFEKCQIVEKLTGGINRISFEESEDYDIYNSTLVIYLRGSAAGFFKNTDPYNLVKLGLIGVIGCTTMEGTCYDEVTPYIEIAF